MNFDLPKCVVTQNAGGHITLILSIIEDSCPSTFAELNRVLPKLNDILNRSLACSPRGVLITDRDFL